ncbi:MAG: MurR/RpiR family transcriptional regulator [Alphaproteobacteria bacterium]|nr:MurR/RpiR family transcriptional regulator [Alphaproteobacteria bacterium]
MSRSRRDGESRSIAWALSRIRAGYKDMTATNRAVADYVLEHHKEMAFASVMRVAARVGVSAATVVRFAESLGLSGFTELQALAREELRRSVDTVSQLRRTGAKQDAQTVLASALRADIANLEKALESLPEEEFGRAVDLLARAGTVHLVGLRSTFGLVQHFGSYLDWIGRKANVLMPGIGDLPEQLMRVRPGDACIGLSFRRYTRDTVAIFKAAHDAGAATIAMTDSDLSPLAEIADVTLAIPVQFPAFFESRVAVLSVVNALVFGVAVAHRRQTIAALRSHEQAWLAHGTYANESFHNRFNAEMEAFATASGPAMPGVGAAAKPVRRARKPPTRD